MIPVPEKFADLLEPSKKAFAYLGLVKKDGTPQVTPMWFGYDGTRFIINTARGRVKDKILHRRPTVALTIQDPANPYRYLQLSGKVVEESEDGAVDQIRDLCVKYNGHRDFPMSPGEVRVTYKILPEQFDAHAQ